MKLVFFGTPQFSVTVLDALSNTEHELCAIVTQPDRPKGRSAKQVPPPVKQFTEQYFPKLPIHQPAKASNPEFAEILKQYEADLFIVVAYGEILRQNILDIPTKGCINIHASLLPKYRGAAPIQRTLIAGEKETGVTIMYMDLHMDTGDIIQSAACPISETQTYPELTEQLATLGTNALIQSLYDISKNVIQRTPQDHTEATFAPKIQAEEGVIQWDRPARELHNLIRGFPQKPGVWCSVKIRNQPKQLKIIKAFYDSTNHDQSPGSILQYNKTDCSIACKDGALHLLEVQLEGKKAMPIAQFMMGIRKEEIAFL